MTPTLAMSDIDQCVSICEGCVCLLPVSEQEMVTIGIMREALYGVWGEALGAQLREAEPQPPEAPREKRMNILFIFILLILMLDNHRHGCARRGTRRRGWITRTTTCARR